MKKYFQKMLMLLMGGMLMVACGGDDNNGNETPGGTPGGSEGGSTEKEWNKDNTVNVYYITSLDDASANGNVEAVAAYIKSNRIKTAIVDNTDIVKYADPAACQNASTQLSFQSAKFCSFVMEGYQGENIEGSTIVMSHKLNEVETMPVAEGCFLQYVPTQAPQLTNASKMASLPLATVKISTQEQVNAAEEVVKKVTGSPRKAVIVGEVKTALANALVEKMSAINGMKISLVAQPVGDYTLFVQGRTWMLREASSAEVGSQKAHLLSIEAL